MGAPLADALRARTGALLGAVAGPPMVLLGIYPLLAPGVAKADGGMAGAIWIVAIVASWAAGAIGLPLLGASLASGGWIGRTPGRSLANHCIGGAIAAGAAAGVLLRIAPALRGDGDGTLVRLLLMEAGLAAGVLLRFRGREAPPPA